MILFERLRRWWKGRRGPTRSVEMVSCREALERLHEYLDSELAEGSREEIAEHLRVCARCYPHLKLEERFRARVHAALGGEPVPDDLGARVRELLASTDR